MPLHFSHIALPCAVWLCGLWLSTAKATDEHELMEVGKTLFQQQCATCHGKSGEGKQDQYDKPLHGDLPLKELVKVIHDTMPEEDPSACVDREAEAVARFMVDSFYTAEARAKNRPPQIALSRLTVEQFDNSVTDLVSQVDRINEPKGEPGLRGQYFRSRSYNREKRGFERVDGQIDFDFGSGSPGEKFDAKEFSIVWDGSVIADTTGLYEFIIQTGNGVKLYVNDTRKMLIDGWVSSGEGQRELSGSVRLLGGRSYRIKLEFLKYHDGDASVRLMWKPPGRPRQTIGARHLRTSIAQPLYVAKNPLPPDDASFGYPRGTAVSKGWDEATTYISVDAAATTARMIDRLARTKSSDPQRREKIIKYCCELADRAFGRPSDPQLVSLVVGSQFDEAGSIDEAVRRCVISILKSPRFLYPHLPDGESSDGFDVASRISYALWDSLPDRRLRSSAAGGRLLKQAHVESEIRNALKDQRTKTKVKRFFTRWLLLDKADSMAKDDKRYPDFSPELVADLRLSLELFLDEVFWGDAPDYRRLLLSDKLFVNNRIAEYYGFEKSAEADSPSEFRLVSMKEQPRTGVITHPLVLATLAYHHQTSPIHRGVFVTRHLLGRRLNPPPAATEFKDSAFDPKLSMREKVSQLTEAKQCQSCHRVINPLGFSLENYDAVGKFRTVSRQRKIDATSDYPSASGKIVRLEGARDLALLAAESTAAQQGFVRQLFEHMIKQPPAAYGPDTMERLHQQFVKNDFDVQKLLVDIVTLTSMHCLQPQ